MDTQGQIIALLQGDLRNGAEVAQLLRGLADSPEEIDMFLRQIDLSRRLFRLGRGVSSAATRTRHDLDRRIAAFEKQRSVAVAPVAESDSRSSGARKLFIAGLILAVMASGIWLGYVMGKHDSATAGPAFVSGDKEQTVPPAATTPGSGRKEEITDRKANAGTTSPLQPVLSPPHRSASSEGREPDSRNAAASALPDISATLPSGASGTSATVSTAAEERPSVRLLGPGGGELFRSGDIIPITWDGTPPDSPMTIEVSRDGGVRWQTLAQDARDGRFLWAIPEETEPGSEYLLKVRPDVAPQETTDPLDLVMIDEEGISVDVSPDGRYLATGGRDTLFTLWDIEKQEKVFALHGHGAPIQSCRFSSDGRKVITSALDGTAIIWNVDERRAERILDGNMGANVWWAAFAPDGKTAATGHDEGTVILWNAETGAERSRIRPHLEGVRYLEFTPDGTRLLTASTDRTACITDVGTGDRVRRFVHNTVTRYVRFPSRAAMGRAVVNAIQLTADGATAITCGLDGDVKFWDVRTGKLIRTRSYNQGKQVSMIRLSPDNRVLMTIGDDGTMALVDPNTGALLSRCSLRSASAREERVPMIHIGIGADPRTAAVSHSNGRVSIWNIEPQGAVSGAYWTIRNGEETNRLK